ncbi:MAG: hypothetical protein LBG73_09935 [Spirochaetaceae bacterium]|jgi:predicted transposase/invertase (TIGR01784 family)|nr:hypothetical protein [Spirochaetaceae bacterium]
MNAKERWAVFFKYCTDKENRSRINEILKYEEGIAMAGEELLTISRDEHERARLLSELKYELDMQSRMVNAKREGMAAGRREEKEEIARKLKVLGLPVRQIIQGTGLTEEQIKEL